MSNWYAKEVLGEVPYSEIGANKDNFHFWNFEPIFELYASGYETVIDKLKEYTAERYLALDDVGKKGLIDEVLAIYREVDVFPIRHYSYNGILNDIERCISYDAVFNGNTVSTGAGVGTGICNYIFPNLFDVPSKHDMVKSKEGAETAYLKFKNDSFLRRSIEFCFSYKNGCPVPTNVMGGLRLVGSTPTNFRPMNAKAIYNRFVPEGGVVYDYCCVSGDTEYYNGKEWKYIKDFTEGEKVLQYNEDGTAELVNPLRYIKYEDDTPIISYFPGEGGSFRSDITLNHNIVYRGKNGELRKIPQKDAFAMRLEGVPLSYVYDGPEKVTTNIIQILAIILSSLKGLERDDTKNVWKLILLDRGHSPFNRLKNYLKNLGLWCSFYSSGLDEVIFEVEEDFFDVMGCFGRGEASIYLQNWVSKNWGISLNLNLKKAFIEECFLFKDSCFDDSVLFMPSSCYFEESASFIEGVFESSGYACDLVWSNLPDVGRQTYILKHSETGVYDINSGSYLVLRGEDGGACFKYCFTVPSGMLVLRNDVGVYISGNCGFGGRMLGCLTSKKNLKYVGVDPNTETMYHLHELGNYIETVTGRDDSYELHCCGSEDFCGPAESIDFAFSSPPYFDLEVYSDEETQCFNKFPNLEDWLEGYVRATIKNISIMLKRGSCYAVNIADFKVGSKDVAYVDEWIRMSTEEGMPLYDTVYLGVTARAGSKLQERGELKKENILVFKKS